MLRASVFFVLLSSFVLSGCASLQQAEKPHVAVTSLEIGEATGLSQSFLIGLAISNPNATPLQVKGMSYSLSVNGFELLEGVKSGIPVLEPYSETSVELRARANIINAVRFINSYLHGDISQALTYRLQAKLDIGGWPGRLSVVEEGEIPVLAGADD